MICINNLLLQIIYLIVTLFAGMFGYSIDFLCTLCDEDNTLAAVALILFFPIPMGIGIYRAFNEILMNLVV